MEKYISKEQALMQLTGEFPKDMSLEKYIGLVSSRINELATTDVIPILEEATNGDMIQNMFPNLRVEDNGGSIYLHYPDGGGWIYFERDWWYATYKT